MKIFKTTFLLALIFAFSSACRTDVASFAREKIFAPEKPAAEKPKINEIQSDEIKKLLASAAQQTN